MVSGAGHDAAYIARVAPTTMIFVPCEGGLSHNEAEATSFEECAAGAQVLLNAVVEYDRRLGGWRSAPLGARDASRQRDLDQTMSLHNIPFIVQPLVVSVDPLRAHLPV